MFTKPPSSDESMSRGAPGSRHVSRARGSKLRSTITGAPQVLLAEDDDEMRSLLLWSLKRAGYEVTECRDGRCLLRYLDPRRPGSSTHSFDLIITDVRMPGLNGLEVLRILEGTAAHLPPVFVITAFGDREIHREVRRLGVTAIFDKPFEIDDLLKNAAELLEKGPRGAGTGAPREAELLEVELFVPADPTLIEPTVETLVHEARSLGQLARTGYEVGMALREALANAMIHGCKRDSDQSIQVVMAFDPSGGVSIIVRDPGCGFCEELVPDPTQTDHLLSKGGRGIFLIREFMDEVHFEGGGSEIHMYKKDSKTEPVRDAS